MSLLAPFLDIFFEPLFAVYDFSIDFCFSLIMIGDGMTDLEAYPPAELFIGFGGNKVRQNVLEKAPWFIYDFQELIQPLRNEKVKES